MIFPNFQAGMRKVSARELQNLSDAVRALWNMRGGPGISITKTSSGVTLSAVGNDFQSAGLVRNCALYRKINDGDKMLTVRRVAYAVEPPEDDGTGPYKWADEPFSAYPFFGRKIDEYKPFEPEENDAPLPLRTMDFLHVQRESYGWVAWFPETSTNIKECVVRWPPFNTGFEESLWVQEVGENDAGAYVIIGDPFEARVQKGFYSIDYFPLRWERDDWSHSANTINVFLIDGQWVAQQTTKFTLERRDPSYFSDDCTLPLISP